LRRRVNNAHQNVDIFGDIAFGVGLDNLLDRRTRIQLLTSCHDDGDGVFLSCVLAKYVSGRSCASLMLVLIQPCERTGAFGKAANEVTGHPVTGRDRKSGTDF
jgi:hypothetical protein